MSLLINKKGDFMKKKLKLGEIRKPSRGCLNWCDKKGCFDKVQEIDKNVLAWVVHCKEAKKLCQDAVKKLNKILK